MPGLPSMGARRFSLTVEIFGQSPAVDGLLLEYTHPYAGPHWMAIQVNIPEATHTIGRVTADLYHSSHSHILPAFGSKPTFSCRLCARLHSNTSLIRLQVGTPVGTDTSDADAMFEEDL